jgi:hypothetical protein
MTKADNIFTSVYVEHLEKLEKAKRLYETVPNEFTKKAKIDLEAKKFTYKERYTPEYIKEYQEGKKQSETNAENELRHLMNAMHVEDLYGENKITDERRMTLHEKNDKKFNLSYLSYGNNY